MDLQSQRTKWLPFLLMIISTLTTTFVSTQELPEELIGKRCSHEHAINLPTAGKCVVPVTTSYDWTIAQTKCEQVKGHLYTMPSGDLRSRPKLLQCIRSYDGDKFDDMWINGVSLWSPQFRWVNGTAMNKVRYCPQSRPRIPRGEAMTTSLNLDSCVTKCQERGLYYTVMQAKSDTLQCYCLNYLNFDSMVTCASSDLDFRVRGDGKWYIVPSNSGSLVDVSGGSTFSTSDILCTMVDNSTRLDGRLQTASCFTRKSFLCALNSTRPCTNNRRACSSQHCVFKAGTQCLKRVNDPHTWYAARDFCKKQGGDLWMVRGRADFEEVSLHLTGDSLYWTGATNYQWQFDPNSAKLYPLNGDYRTARCAHIYRQKGPQARPTRRMEWSDTPCDQAKSFLCEFNRPSSEFAESERGHEVTCPWPIIELPTERPPPVTETVYVGLGGDSFPLAAVISGIVAGLILLTCLSLIWGLCARSRRGLIKETMAYVPYFAGDTSHVEFETMSNAADHTMRSSGGGGNLRSASEHGGSQVGLVKSGYYHNSSSYGMSNSQEFSSKSLDRRHLDAVEHKMSESHHDQYLTNHNSSSNSFTEEQRQFASATSYQAAPSGNKEFMTLQANMRIQDEAELAAMRRSLRGKPEVTLVTDHMDMNFTVNHAHGAGSDVGERTSPVKDSSILLHSTPVGGATASGGFEHRDRSFADIALHDL